MEVKRMKGLEPSTFCMASRRSSQLSYIREVRKVYEQHIRPATWRNGYAAACKAVYTGSIPVVALRETRLQSGFSLCRHVNNC
jgi:hypothetical protein